MIPEEITPDGGWHWNPWPDKERQGLGDWLSRSAVLPSLAAVCFILVFALLLRTITDYGYLNLRIGSLLGLGLCYPPDWPGCPDFMPGGSRLAPVFAGCGLLLLFSIVVESLNRFHTMSPAPAILLLLAALGWRRLYRLAAPGFRYSGDQCHRGGALRPRCASIFPG